MTTVSRQQPLTQRTPSDLVNVAILGAESTGKTTLCQDLAVHLNCKWVAEFMRPYLQQKWDNEHKTCEWEDLLPIARGQIALENSLAQQSADYLFCDTSLFELMVYANWYYGKCPAAITEAALAHHYDLILLTEVDVPWVADDLRDAPHEREQITASFAEELTQHGKAFRRIGGDRETRVTQVVNWLAEFATESHHDA